MKRAGVCLCEDVSEYSGTDAFALSAWVNVKVIEKQAIRLRSDYDKAYALTADFDVARVLG